MEALGFLTYVSEWAPVEEPSRRGSGGGPFTHLQIVRAPLRHQPAWGNLIFVSPADESLFEQVLARYLIETHRQKDDLVSAAASSIDRLSHLERSIANREARIGSLESRMARRDARIAELDAAISQRDARIAALDSAIGQRDTRYRWTVGILIGVCVFLAAIGLVR
jgi:septal ring factor EnvC (AmiA/AmiB activator)